MNDRKLSNKEGFIKGGCGCMILLVLILVVSAFTGGFFTLNIVPFISAFIIGGVVGLIYVAVANKRNGLD